MRNREQRPGLTWKSRHTQIGLLLKSSAALSCRGSGRGIWVMTDVSALSCYPRSRKLEIELQENSSIATSCNSSAVRRALSRFRRLAVPCLVAGAFASVLIFLLRQPAISSGDGPVHLYYSAVIRALLIGDPWYGHWYVFRHLIQPYSLYYLLLALMQEIASPAAAEKTLVTLTVLVCWTGLLRAIRAFRPETTAMYAWILPLILTWSLAGGFYNFCLASGFLFHAIASWVSLRRSGAWPALVTLSACLVLLVLSHPVPLLLLAGYLVLETLFSRWMPAPANRHLQFIARFAVLAALVTPALVYDRSRLGSEISLAFHKMTALFVYTGQCVDFFTFAGIHVPYRVALLGFPLFALAHVLSGIFARLRSRAVDEGDVLALTAMVLLFTCSFLPTQINGALNAERRLAALAWPVLLIALASRSLQEKMGRRIFAATGCAMTLAAAVALPGSLTPDAQLMADLDRAPLPVFRVGIFLESNAGLNSTPATGYGLAYWAGVHSFAARHDILLNCPWLNETHIPLREQTGSAFLEDIIDRKTINTPVRFYDALTSSDSLRTEISRRIDFAVFVDPGNSPAEGLRAALDPHFSWSCSSREGYAVCTKNQL